MKTAGIFSGKIFSIFLLTFWLIHSFVYSQTFHDDLSNESEGQFPSKWDLIQGQAQITAIDGSKAIKLDNKSIIKPDSGNTDYLDTAFTLEFEAYFEAISGSSSGIHYDIRFWDGTTGTVSFTDDAGDGTVKPLIIYRSGVKLVTKYNGRYTTYDEYKSELRDNNGVWRTIKITYASGTLKVDLDGLSILNVPKYGYDPRIFSIQGHAIDNGEPLLSAIKNVSLRGNSTPEIAGSDDMNVGTSDNSNFGIVDTTTQPELINNNVDTIDPSGLEALDEGRGRGWRLVGRAAGYIGYNAVDLSLNGRSNGRSSFTMGEFAHALGDFSIAMGYQAHAKENYSLAIGADVVANGGSTAIGLSANATGGNSVALGKNNYASGHSSVAIGSENTASADYSTAMGNKTTASGSSSTAMGLSTEASGNASTAMGFNTKSIGENSIAMGVNTEAKERYSTAMGNKTLASGESSTAMGKSTIASGLTSTAMGNSTLSEGNYSLATGNNTKATGTHSASFGEDTVAETRNSVAMGFGTVAQSINSLVIGQFNELVFTNNEILFQIGNGTGETSRRDAFWVAKSGNAMLRGNLTQTSDERLKKNITDIPYGLNEILRLNPKSYNWKDIDEKQKSLGLIAQEVQPIINELVQIGQNEDEFLSLNYVGLVPVLIKAMQEQQDIIQTQNKKIDHLSSELSEKDEVLSDLKNRVKQIETLLKQDKL